MATHATVTGIDDLEDVEGKRPDVAEGARVALPCMSRPTAWQQSSITAIPRLLREREHRVHVGSGFPACGPGMIARVLPVILLFSVLRIHGERLVDLREHGCGSDLHDGRNRRDEGVAGTSTSSPGPIFSAFSAHMSARFPELTAKVWFTPIFCGELPFEQVDLLLEGLVVVLPVAGQVPALENIQDLFELFVSRQICARDQAC